MGALADIYALAKIVLDTGSFETDAVKAGDAAANKVSTRMSGTIKKGVGAALAAGFTAAAAGASALDTVAANLQAHTGASADEAQRMAEAINAVAGSTRTSLSSVADAYEAVVTDMQLTGKAAEDTTRRVVDFARVTGTTAAEDVKRLDDVSDAWNLTNEQSLGILDQLIASHDRYGGSITDNMQALKELAPQLQALGASVDDGIGLLNLFASSGLDASKATFALNTAVQKLKPGQSLDDLVAQISSIEDPTLRAQKAVEVFGARGGVALANSLKPGIGSLKDFGVSAGQSAGAVEKAASAIDSTIPGMVQGVISGAQAAVRGFGDTFGPGLMAIAAAASLWESFAGVTGFKMGGALKWAWARVAANPAVLAAANAAGVTQGAALSAGVTAALIAAPIVVTYVVAQAGNEGMDKQRQAVSDSVRQVIAGGSLEGMQRAMAQLRQELALQESNNSGISGFVTRLFGIEDQRPKIQADIAALGSAIDESMRNVFDHGWSTAAQSTTAASAQFNQAGNAAGAAYVQGYIKANDLQARIAQDIRDTMAAAAQAVRDSKQQLLSAWSSALDETTALADAKDQIIVNNAQIAAQRKILADRKATAAEKAQARITLRDLEARNAQLLAEQSQYGTRSEQIAKTKALRTSKALLNGLKSKDPDVRQHWLDVKAAAETQLQALQDEAKTYGYNTASSYAKGIRNGRYLVQTAAGLVAQDVKDHFQVRSPAKKGPLSSPGGPERYGQRLVELYARGMASAISAVSASSSAVAVAAIPRAAPPTASRAALSAAAAGSDQAAAAGGGAPVYNFNMPVQGLVRARNPLEMATQARRLARLGIMSAEAPLK